MTTLDLDEAFTVERKPGQFQRHPKTGAPYVAHPTDVTKKTGLPKRVMYGRPSGLGKQIENLTNLQKWSERMEALGLVMDPALYEEARALAHLDQDSSEFKDLADSIAVRAKAAAQAHLAAERGTHHHELTEDYDTDRDPIARMAAGESLGVPRHVQRALLDAWASMLTVLDIEILATEATCVDDAWRQAGTLDRIGRLRRALRFVLPGGEVVILPAGLIVVLDIKTGRLRLDDKGFVSYWRAYAVQCASYAQSRPYDPDTDTRGEWPWEVDQRWAIIAHLDILAALDGEAVCRLFLVDLEAGREAGALCVAARGWEKRTDVFSVPCDDLSVRVPVIAPDELDVEPPVDAAPVTRRQWLLARVDVVKAKGFAVELKAVWPRGVPGTATDHRHSDDEIDQVHAALDIVEKRHGLPLEPDPADVAAKLDTILDARRDRAVSSSLEQPTDGEGQPLSDEELDDLRAEIDRAQPEHRALLTAWLIEANAVGLGFSAASKPTTRRRAVLRAGLALADLCGGEASETDLALAVLAAVPGNDGIAQRARVADTVGMTLGLLDQAQAEAVVGLAKRAPDMALKYVAGRPRLVDQIAS